VTVAILLMADPPNQCPNWHLKNPHSTSLWQCVGMLTAPLNIFVTSLRSLEPVRRNGYRKYGPAGQNAVRPYDPARNSRDSYHGPCVRRDVFTFSVAAVLACHPVHRSLRPDSERSKHSRHSRSRIARKSNACFFQSPCGAINMAFGK
jgi:hypothetical protein